MGKKGEVRLSLTRREAKILGEWLLETYAPPPPSVMAGTSHRDQQGRKDQAARLGEAFARAAIRRRTSEGFVMLIYREDAKWLSHFYDVAVIGQGYLVADNEEGFLWIPFEIWPLLKRCRDAFKSRQGNRHLTPKKLADRVERLIAVDPTHRSKLARRARYNQAFAEWSARGNTILGGREPPPFI